MPGDRLFIGIAGGSGSGKTTLSSRLLEQFAGQISVVSHDDYYKAHDELTLEERAHINYDHPNAFDTDLLIEHLRRLRKGEAIECPEYDYCVHNRKKETHTVWPRRVILVEGILIFENPILCRELDVKVFVDTDNDVRLLRRISRDLTERGRTLESVEEQYLATVKPMHEQYVEPSKKNADIIVVGGGKNPVAFAMLSGLIEKYLAGNTI